MYPLCGAAESRVYDSASLTRGSCPEEAEGDLGGGPSPPPFPRPPSLPRSRLPPRFFLVSQAPFSFRIRVPVGEWENERDRRRTTCPWPIQFFPPRLDIRRAPSYVSHAHARTNAFVFPWLLNQEEPRRRWVSSLPTRFVTLDRSSWNTLNPDFKVVRRYRSVDDDLWASVTNTDTSLSAHWN